ncbi:MAG: DUF447 domain-containing protein [Methylophilaceae bacterium]|nr:DUF447 domain-containing protein [Methyloradius sp.]
MIYETIVTTLDEQGQPYIAPFGIRERNGLILIAPFRPSHTLDNLMRSKSAVLNLVDDVRIFAGAFVGKRDWPTLLANMINGVYLNAALAHRELELVEIKEDDTRPELYFRVVHEVNHQAFKGFNRAQTAVVELSVLVSRLHMLPIEKIESEMTYLQIAIDKTAGPRELEAWGWLLECIENHKAKISGNNLA